MILRFNDGLKCVCDGNAPICKQCAEARKSVNREMYCSKKWLEAFTMRIEAGAVEEAGTVDALIALAEKLAVLERLRA